MKMIIHDVNGLQIGQRREDGYINLTKMAKANNKKINDYLRLDTTKAFLDELSTVTGIPVDLLTEINKLENLIISIRSQARTFHTGSHQPADDHLVKSLHSISHNQLNIINSAIERLQRLKQVAEMNSELEINADIDREKAPNLDMGIPVSKTELNQQPPSNPTMTDITAANFIDSIPVVTKEATVRFTVDLPESMHRDLSILAAKRGVSKADIVRLLLDDALKDVDD